MHLVSFKAQTIICCSYVSSSCQIVAYFPSQVSPPTLTFQSLVAFPDPYYFAKAPLYMKTPVVSGFGRGSRELGFPTGELALYDAAASQAVPDLLKLETSQPFQIKA
jgi:hypothetical protein